MFGLLAVAMDTLQQRDEGPGSFSTSPEGIVKMTSLAAVTVVTGLTSDTSHKWSRCCLQVDGQQGRFITPL
ncbi:Polyprotein P1234 [Dissostichus eleginoides]|uniref:Polyprotein P1234 n=1 Tax=Dissostichus eleginoides TaxID=100907 RepID=A0AAD9F9V8_DISEL|nr:Polyprotein P1234 [Dissostichus eleginoides]